nr:uncharacterized protein LOC118681047 [Bactrocera oleae]
MALASPSAARWCPLPVYIATGYFKQTPQTGSATLLGQNKPRMAPELQSNGDPTSEIGPLDLVSKGESDIPAGRQATCSAAAARCDEENLSHIVFRSPVRFATQPTSDAAFRLLCAYLMSTTMRRA